MTITYYSDRKRLTIKGHKLTRSTSGAGSGYARGECECGEFYKGWTERVGDVVRWHQSHLYAIKAAKAAA